MSRWALVLASMLTLTASSVAAQSAPANPYRPNAADEDWTFLKNAEKTDFWDPVKYLELGPEDWSLSLSSEIRFRGEGFRVRETNLRPSSTDNYMLQRYLVGADLRFGPRARVFGEVQSGLINGRLRSPRPTDRNPVDVHQGFFEWRQPVGRTSGLGVVVGRQEIEIGTSRLISASAGLNVKRSFDGVVAAYRTKSWRFAAVGAQLVSLNPGTFDDRADHGQLFWGGAATWAGRLLGPSEMGAYYLGIDRNQSIYAQASGPEVRHTVGAGWKRGGSPNDLNWDAVYQWGKFSDAPIRAWAFATETGYRWPTAWRPRVSVRVDIASGDTDRQEPSLQSFNPLFPGNSYSGAVGLLGPTNLTDFTPAITVSPRAGLILSFEAPSYWRTSTDDGVYNTSLAMLFSPDTGEGKYVGTNPAVLAVWQATRHLQLQGVITRFVPGRFLDRTFISDGFGFYSFTLRYRI